MVTADQPEFESSTENEAEDTRPRRFDVLHFAGYLAVFGLVLIAASVLASRARARRGLVGGASGGGVDPRTGQPAFMREWPTSPNQSPYVEPPAPPIHPGVALHPDAADLLRAQAAAEVTEDQATEAGPR